MNSFLQETAEAIKQKYGNRLKDICIVVPNERTKIYLNIAMGKLHEGPSWAMNVFRIRDLATNITGLQSGNKIALIFKLFDIFQNHFSKKSSIHYNLEQFYSLGEVLISDFNEIDNWLAKPEQIFRNIRDVKEIESLYDHLSEEQREVLSKFRTIFSVEHISKEKEKLLQMWNIIPLIYNDFKKYLLSQKTGYTGMIMRAMSEKVMADKAELPEYDKFIFVGFNALTKAEMSLPKYLMRNSKAEFFQDTDAYYHKDQRQEAGLFLRKNTKELKLDEQNIPQRIFRSDDPHSNENRTINLYGVPQNIGQAKIIPSLLDHIDKIDEHTAVILADESMMLPVLHSLPEKLEDVNVSMGYSLNDTKLTALIRLYLKSHSNDDKTGGVKRYDYKTVQTIVKHPAVERENPELSQQIISTINRESPISIPAADLIEQKPELYKLLFTAIPKENAGEILLTNLMNILFLIFEREEGESLQPKENIENEAIYHVYKRIKKFKELLAERKEQFSVSFTSQLLSKLLADVVIPFKGKKATGLQVLGVLETRNIDFKNIIILGMNEGNFPKIQSKPSFLTQSLRFAFDLPLVQHQDAVYAYLFYRLLHRSQTINLVYNSLSDSDIGEKSRFISQLQYESAFEFDEKQFYQDLKISEGAEITIQKSSEIMEVLEKYNLKSSQKPKRFSASALNTYISCSLKFYFRYVAGLKEPDKAEDEISPALFGNILHKAAEIMYSKLHKGNAATVITAEKLKAERKNAKEFITEAINKVGKIKASENELFEGKGEVIREVLAKYLKMIIDTDLRYVPFRIYSLEADKFSSTELTVDTPAGKKELGFVGIIDRIDIKDDVFRIIDYKSGKADKTFSSFDDLFVPEKNSKYKAILQMYLYGLMFKSKMQNVTAKPGIYNLRDMSKPGFSADLSFKEGRKRHPVDGEFFNSTISEFSEHLKILLSEIFDPAVPFSQTQDDKNCTYCPYIGICNR
ncbi:MAG: PD-(D/E)XK nuclease family protein [Bacteroidota bacterium]|nr:PD-(D/E)XK nuclease family protein [Bacteroidota bacterium]